MLKKIILISIVVMLAVTAWYFNNQRNSIISSQDFIISDTSAIDKIILKKDGQSLKLEKLEVGWMVNDTFQVNYALVKRFLRVFANLGLVAPISDSATDTILASLQGTGTEITVFANNSLRKKYLLGHLNASGSGNIVFLDEEKLAIVNSIGLVKDLNSIFSVSSLYWRNRMVFNKSAGKIARLSHKNILSPDKSYTIYSENGEFRLLNYKNEQIIEFDQTAIKRYLSYFRNIGFEQVENSLSTQQLDSVLNQNHAHTIFLMDDSGISYELNLYLKPEFVSENRLSKAFDLNQIYGRMNNEDNILIFDYYIIDPILKDIDYFVQKIK